MRCSVESFSSMPFSASAASCTEYPNATNPCRASSFGLPDGIAKKPVASSEATRPTLSLRSTTTRSATRFPTPTAWEINLVSPEAIACLTCATFATL